MAFGGPPGKVRGWSRQQSSSPVSKRARFDFWADTDRLTRKGRCEGFIEMLSLGLSLCMSEGIIDMPCGRLDRNAGEKEGSV